MKHFIIILIMCSIFSSCSKSIEKAEAKPEFKGDFQITNGNLLISLNVKNNGKEKIEFNTFHKGRFEPLTVSTGDNIIAKQGGWDLLKVRPNELNINVELLPTQSKTFEVLCIHKDKTIIDDSNLIVNFTYLDENGWHKETITLKKMKTERTRRSSQPQTAPVTPDFTPLNT